MNDNKIPEFINRMPKIEIHLHIEGAFTFDFLFKLIQKYGGNTEIQSMESLKKKFVFKDFSHFIDTWFWKNQFYKSPEDFEESVYSTLESLSSQNVVYVEAFFSPWDFAPAKLKPEAITEAVISGVKKAESYFPIKCNIIADIVRDHGADTSMSRLNTITPYFNKGVVGLGLGGNEKDFPPYLFKEVFEEAKKRGFRLTAHAGEASGADSIWSVINDLGVERIGHGVRAAEDPVLVEYLQENQIPLEVCITSNLKTKVFSSLEEHPFDDFFKKGLMVTINSDDPPMFGAGISEELFLLYKKLNYSSNDLLKLMENAVRASFLDDQNKKILYNLLKNFSQSLSFKEN